MAAPPNDLSFNYEKMNEAAQTWRQRTAERQHNIEMVKRKQYDQVESRERLAKRANRLLEKVKRSDHPGALSPELEELVERGPITEDEIDNFLFERVIGETRDFLSIEFLEKGFLANRCVGRIVRPLGNNRVSYGTGFLVAPGMLMTNWHVLKAETEAQGASIEFDYQVDRFGAPLTVQRFKLDPGAFFLNDKDLDFALVGVKDSGGLDKLGWCPLIAEEGKITMGNCVNIIQHPRGEMKQIVIRENELVDLLDVFLHYQGDTEPGSSGSPVFNDQWEVVALHHSSIPKTDASGRYLNVNGKVWKNGDDPNLLAWVSNEGIRVSRLVSAISKAKVKSHEKALWKAFLDAKEPPRLEEIINQTPEKPRPVQVPGAAPVLDEAPRPANPQPGVYTMTVPLNITVTLGTPAAAAQVQAQAQGFAPGAEAIEPDPDYDHRPGYNPDFLGFPTPLPTLRSSIAGKAAQVPGGGNELKYHHYSAIVNRERRLAFVSAVNYDAGAPFNHKREGNDRWFPDPRISDDFQTDNSHYASNPLDRGHLVRRADAAWGYSKEEARLANDDTFHFSNCSPQHEVYNQSTKADDRGVLLWGNLEEHIAKEAKRDKKKLCIFNGPILRSNDRPYRGIRVPKEFYKIVVFEKENGGKTALAFLLSQASLIQDLPAEEFQIGPYQPFQVKVSDIERMTKLDFVGLSALDPLENPENESFFESGTEAVPLASAKDIVF